MQEAIKYGERTKKQSVQPSGQPVHSRRGGSWMRKLKTHLKDKLTLTIVFYMK